MRFIRKLFSFFTGVTYEQIKYINIGKRCSIGKNSVISGYKGGYLNIGNNVRISCYCKLATCGGKLIVDDNVQIGDYCTITAQGGVFIENNVLMADKINIIANQHRYEDISVPIMGQGQISKPIYIKSGTWIGINVTVLDGVTIGKNCIIGANSVVTKDIPDFSVAVGTPARVIKLYDKKLSKWIRV